MGEKTFVWLKGGPQLWFPGDYEVQGVVPEPGVLSKGADGTLRIMKLRLEKASKIMSPAIPPGMHCQGHH